MEKLEDWLFDAGANAKAAAYKVKRNDTEALLAPGLFRLAEAERRPAAITRCQAELAKLAGFPKRLLNSTTTGNHTAEAKAALEKDAAAIQAAIEDTGKWVKEKSELQKGLKPHEVPEARAPDSPS